jgi:hypothetical protein
MKQEYSKLSEEELFEVMKKDVIENMWEWGYQNETSRDFETSQD